MIVQFFFRIHNDTLCVLGSHESGEQGRRHNDFQSESSEYAIEEA